MLNEKSVSKAQQALFGMVHAIQKGKHPIAGASPLVRKLAAQMKPDSVKAYASSRRARLPKKLHELIQEEYHPVLAQLQMCVKHGKPVNIEGTHVDLFTANLLLSVSKSLTGNNKSKFLDLPIPRMVATAYKLITTRDI